MDYRQKCLSNKERKCSKCGKKDPENLEVHHIDEDRSNNNLSNLLPLCRDCHRRYHAGNLDLSEHVDDADTEIGLTHGARAEQIEGLTVTDRQRKMLRAHMGEINAIPQDKLLRKILSEYFNQLYDKRVETKKYKISDLKDGGLTIPAADDGTKILLEVGQ